MPSSETKAAAAAAAATPAHFSWMQTRMALERTLLAWVRTAAALIGFGFALVHFFAAIDTIPTVRPAWRPGAARALGTSLAVVGTIALALATVQYLLLVRYLDGEQFREVSGYGGVPRFRPLIWVTAALLAVGVIVSWALVTRVVW
jgi:putative membrane protein